MATSSRDELIEGAISCLISACDSADIGRNERDAASRRVASLLVEAWQQDALYLKRLLPLIVHHLLLHKIINREISQKAKNEQLIYPISQSLREILLHGREVDQESELFYLFSSCATRLMMLYHKDWTERCKSKRMC